jgi:hypothetical protein
VYSKRAIQSVKTLKMDKYFRIIYGIIFLIVFLTPWICLYAAQKRRAKIPKMTIDELKQMAIKSPVLYSGNVVREILSRGEDINFAFPLFLKMACSKKYLESIFGWAGLKAYFTNILEGIDFTEKRPSKTTVERLRLIESQIRDNSANSVQP